MDDVTVHKLLTCAGEFIGLIKRFRLERVLADVRSDRPPSTLIVSLFFGSLTWKAKHHQMMVRVGFGLFLQSRQIQPLSMTNSG